MVRPRVCQTHVVLECFGFFPRPPQFCSVTSATKIHSFIGLLHVTSRASWAYVAHLVTCGYMVNANANRHLCPPTAESVARWQCIMAC